MDLLKHNGDLEGREADRMQGCTDAKRHERIGGFVEKCFGANHTFSPMGGIVNYSLH